MNKPVKKAQIGGPDLRHKPLLLSVFILPLNRHDGLMR